MRFLVALFVCVLCSCSWNVPDIKEHAKSRLSEFGYAIVCYEGYQWSAPDGGQVWYMVRKTGDKNDVRYECFLTKWQGEYHLYNLQMVDKNLINKSE